MARGTPITAITRPSASASWVICSTSQGRAIRVNWSPSIEMAPPDIIQRKFGVAQQGGARGAVACGVASVGAGVRRCDAVMPASWPSRADIAGQLVRLDAAAAGRC